MAGSHVVGVEHADSELFAGRRVVVTVAKSRSGSWGGWFGSPYEGTSLGEGVVGSGLGSEVVGPLEGGALDGATLGPVCGERVKGVVVGRWWRKSASSGGKVRGK